MNINKNGGLSIIFALRLDPKPLKDMIDNSRAFFVKIHHLWFCLAYHSSFAPRFDSRGYKAFTSQFLAFHGALFCFDGGYFDVNSFLLSDVLDMDSSIIGMTSD